MSAEYGQIMTRTWTRPLGEVSVNHPDVEVKPGDWLVTQGTHSPDPQVHGLAVSLDCLLVVKWTLAFWTLKQLPL